jgi:hypothetical protein
MTRALLASTGLSLVLMASPGCLSPSDDDDASSDDDDASVSDDDDATAANEVAESEPNDEHPFQDLGLLVTGRTAVSGTLSTAGAEPTGAEWFTGDLDVFTFRVSDPATVQFSLNWDAPGDDLDVLLFASVTDQTVLTWNSGQLIAQSATEDRPEEFSSPLSANVEYSVLVGNFAGDPNTNYFVTIDVP